MDQDRILAFFRGGRDDRGRTLEEILAWEDDELEEVHDFVQWVFPTARASDFNPEAPVLTEASIEGFHADADLRRRLFAALGRMLRFYGFELSEERGEPVVRRGSNWSERSAEWFAPGDHNLLRITRILDCLSTLGLGGHAKALLRALEELEKTREGRLVGPRTFRFWREATRS